MSTKLAKALEPLNDQERIFVGALLKGSTQIAAATLAGYARPQKMAYQHAAIPRVKKALDDARRIGAEEVDFTRKKAHDMLMDAHSNAEDTIGQVTAIRELIKLHGIAAVEKKEIVHKHEGEVGMRGMSDQELVKLAGYENALDAEFHEVGEAECLPAPNAE